MRLKNHRSNKISSVCIYYTRIDIYLYYSYSLLHSNITQMRIVCNSKPHSKL